MNEPTQTKSLLQTGYFSSYKMKWNIQATSKQKLHSEVHQSQSTSHNSFTLFFLSPPGFEKNQIIKDIYSGEKIKSRQRTPSEKLKSLEIQYTKNMWN